MPLPVLKFERPLKVNLSNSIATVSSVKSPVNPVSILTSVVLNQSQGGMCIRRVLGIEPAVSQECFAP